MDPLVVLESIIIVINKWVSLMDGIGGAISINKSQWYLVEYIFKQGKWVAHDYKGEIDLQPTTPPGDIASLRRLGCGYSAARIMDGA